MTSTTADDTFSCSGCGRDLPRSGFHEFAAAGRSRPVTSRCRGCRSRGYYAARYTTTCACCQEPRPVDGNQVCRACNLEAGLRECRRCARLQAVYLCFYGRSRVCKGCAKKRT